MENKLYVTGIQRFCLKDGDGIRTTIFTADCPLKCKWCHNPETATNAPKIFYSPEKCLVCGKCAAVCPNNCHILHDLQHFYKKINCISCGKCAAVCPTQAIESTGEYLSPLQIAQKVLEDKVFYGNNGGATFSGGEPLCHGDEIIQVLALLKEHNVKCQIETSGFFDDALIERILPLTDCFLWDIKVCREDYTKYTGGDYKKMLSNLYRVDLLGGRTILRCMILKGINSGESHMDFICEIYNNLKNCRGVQVLKYHLLGDAKRDRLGLSPIGDSSLIPDNQLIDRLIINLTDRGITVLPL